MTVYENVFHAKLKERQPRNDQRQYFEIIPDINVDFTTFCEFCDKLSALEYLTEFNLTLDEEAFDERYLKKLALAVSKLYSIKSFILTLLNGSKITDLGLMYLNDSLIAYKPDLQQVMIQIESNILNNI